jgi:O-antigen ligase
VIACPVVLAAAIEAILGLTQLFSGAENVVVTGTYTIRNHFAALLELALPFPAMYTLAALSQSPARSYIDQATVLRVAAGAALTTLLAGGALFSLSRGGLAAILTSALVTAAVATNWNMPLRRKVATACLFFLLAAIALFYLTPMTLVARLSEHNSAGRLSVWREAVSIIPQYLLVGCGLGGFESAFLRFKIVEGLFVVDYAHNDYLQLLAELGLAGFLVGVVLLGSVARRVTRLADDASDIRWVALACVGSLAAIAVHSAFDFNLYVGANAAVLAWICGVAAGLKPAVSIPRAHAIEGAPDAVIQRASVSRHRSMPFR